MNILNLNGKKGIVVGIANAQSIAYGCASAFRAAGAELAITYQNDKAARFVRPLAEELQSPIFMPCNVREPGELDALFARVRDEWGQLDFLLHSIAFAPRDDLHGRLVDSSAEGIALAVDISCHSFIRMAKFAEPLMTNGGCLLTVSYYGALKVVPNYGVMGPIKAMLESAVRYLAVELGSKAIRVNAISPGPMPTRAASGIAKFDALLERTLERTPTSSLATPEDVGALAAFLVSDGARAITGDVLYVDGGVHVVA